MKFLELDLHPSVQAGIDELKYVDCTPIQETILPLVMAGKDVSGLAQTGTGKTAAFLVPLIDRIVRSRAQAFADLATGSTSAPEAAPESAPAALSADETATEEKPEARPIFKGWRKSNFILVLVPTRELAEQVYENAIQLGSKADIRATAIYGGTGYDSQKAALRNGIDFVIATPGRLIDLYKENFVDLGQVRAVVFDEADRMFDMGFKDDMKYILRRIPQDRQFLVFSATLNFDVLNTAYEFGADPVEVNVSRDQAKAENVEDFIFHVGHHEKPRFLLSLIQKNAPRQAIIFSNFKHNVERISKFLTANGIPAMGISSLISQSQRTRIMELFRAENDRNILVATDLAARGLDIKGVDLVINFELPEDAENYVHRIGRTGRAGALGKALSMVSDRDVESLQRIETYLGHKVEMGWLEEAELVKDFKEFPRDESRRRDFGDRRPDHRGGGRDSGPRRDGPRRDGHRSDEHRSGGPRGDSRRDGPRGPRDDRGPRHDRGPRPDRGGEARREPRHFVRPEGENRESQNPENRSAHAGQRPPAGGRGPHPRRDQAPRTSPSGKPHFVRPVEQRGGHGRPHQGGRPAPYKHRPQTTPQAGVVAKVKGFLKKIFT